MGSLSRWASVGSADHADGVTGMTTRRAGSCTISPSAANQSRWSSRRRLAAHLPECVGTLLGQFKQFTFRHLDELVEDLLLAASAELVPNPDAEPVGDAATVVPFLEEQQKVPWEAGRWHH